MEHYLPEIFWHDRQGLLSVDFQKNPKSETGHYKIVTTSMQKEVRIWDFSFEKVSKAGERDALGVNFIANITGHQCAVNVARFSPNSEMLASADAGGTVFVWKLSPDIPPSSSVSDADIDDFPQNKENWVRLRAPLRHDSDVNAVCWSTDSQYLASASNDESVVVQNVQTGSRLWTIKNFRKFPNGIVWDPRGKYLVTMSTDRRLDILDAAKGTRLRCFHTVNFKKKVLSEELVLDGTYKLFHDDQLISFMRGADFSPDGELLIAPGGHLEVRDSNVYGTYVIQRCDLDKQVFSFLDVPTAFLWSKKPTFRAVCSPVVFTLRSDVEGNMLGLPYRIVWAVLTLDAIIFYDSQSALPFSYVDNIHYNNLSDAAWSPDGKILLVSSLEGYCSFIRFDLTRIGRVTNCSFDLCPPSPVLIVPKKPKRSSKVTLPNKGTDNLIDSPVRHATTSDPKQLRPVVKVNSSPASNSLIKYFKKTPKAVGELSVPAQQNSTESEMKKQKRRVQLESVPVIHLD